MGVLSTITGLLSGGDIVKDIGNVLDNLHTSGEEKAEAERKIKSILVQAEQAAQQQVSARWEADMKHGSVLSKNIRPLTLIFLTFKLNTVPYIYSPFVYFNSLDDPVTKNIVSSAIFVDLSAILSKL